MQGGYRPTSSGAPAKPPNKSTAGRQAETVYHVHWPGELPKQSRFGFIPDEKVRKMATSVRLDGDMFVVRINGCQHRLTVKDATEFSMALNDAIANHIFELFRNNEA